MKKPLSPKGTADVLAELSHVPQRKLGQNFLIDPNIVRKAVYLADVSEGDTIVEVGPGLGTLTAELLEKRATLYAIEKDTKLFEHLENTLVPNYSNFHLMHGDALDAPLAGLSSAPPSGFKIVANLPYAIATPWLDAVLSQSFLPKRLVVMLQKEAADRFIAQENTKHFSAISIFIKSMFNVAPGHKVSRKCFLPVPKVDSFLLHLTLKEKPFIFKPEAKQLIRDCFNFRRKQITAICRLLKSPAPLVSWIDEIQHHNIPRTFRPEQIPLYAWHLLNRFFL